MRTPISYFCKELHWCWIQYIPRNMHTVFALLCFVVVVHWLIFPYPSGLLHWHCGNLTIAPVPAKQPWWIWMNTSCEFIMNDCITTTKQSTTKPCAYFLGYTVGTVYMEYKFARDVWSSRWFDRLVWLIHLPTDFLFLRWNKGSHISCIGKYQNKFGFIRGLCGIEIDFNSRT